MINMNRFFSFVVLLPLFVLAANPGQTSASDLRTFRATLLAGLSAASGSESIPCVFRTDDLSLLPESDRPNIYRCFIKGSAKLSADRKVFEVQMESVSCQTTDGNSRYTAKVAATATDDAGHPGLPTAMMDAKDGTKKFAVKAGTKATLVLLKQGALPFQIEANQK